MKSYRILIPALAVLCLSSCGQKAQIKGSLEGAQDSNIIVKQLDINVFTVLDTIKTGHDGSFSYKVNVRKGEPEFIYLFHGQTQIAGLLLEQGETAVVSADTLGNYSVTGSEGSAKLAVVDKARSRFNADMIAAGDNAPVLARTYLDHYRESVKFVLENSHSLAVIPVLFEQMSETTPIFNQPTDALLFRNTTDSLKTAYPDSRYVKALEKEAARRIKLLELDGQLRGAVEASFPDIVLPDISGSRSALSAVDSKVILVHFWDASDAAQKMMNIDTLLPIYNDYHKKGFEIYAVCVSADKAAWGSIVNSQKLPWINVNDGQGTASRTLVTYNVSSLPTSILIVDGEISSTRIKGEAGLRKELDRILRR